MKTKFLLALVLCTAPLLADADYQGSVVIPNAVTSHSGYEACGVSVQGLLDVANERYREDLVVEDVKASSYSITVDAAGRSSQWSIKAYLKPRTDRSCYASLNVIAYGSLCARAQKDTVDTLFKQIPHSKLVGVIGRVSKLNGICIGEFETREI